MDSPQKLREYHDFAANLAVRAGHLLCSAAFKRTQRSVSAETTPSQTLEWREKDSGVDVVTDTDIAVEGFIVSRIRERYPEHHILAEETYAAGGSKDFELVDTPSWIVDPLDGTVNFVHMFPLICVSIGLAIDKQPIVGAIYAPLLGGLDPETSSGTLWSSCRGFGAYQSHPQGREHPSISIDHLEAGTGSRGPRPLQLPLSPPAPLSADAPSGMLFASEWGKDRRDGPEGNLLRKANTFLNLASIKGGREGRGVHVQGLRSLGSAALDLAYCATGAVDVFWEGGCWEWDVCAGLAILEEAGGLHTDGNAPPSESDLWRDQPLPPASLGGRRFLCIRPCASTRQETSRQAQERVARKVWKALHSGGLVYNRPGVQYPE